MGFLKEIKEMADVDENKIHFHDKLLAHTILLLVPRRVLPNHFTYVRLAFTPLVLYFILSESYKAALISFLIVAFTDAIDGSLARTRNQITDLGRTLDPIADKILIGSCVFVLMLQHINIFISLAIIFLEAIFLGGWYWRKRRGKEILRVNLWGKIKMVLQVSGVVILLIGLLIQEPIVVQYSAGALLLAIIFALINLFTYGL